MKKVWKYLALCLLCGWKSRRNKGPVYAGGYGIKHLDESHPQKQGFLVALIKED